MDGLTLLRDVQLIPVLELEPWGFSTSDRPSPSGSGLEMPEAWGRYWLDCLADSGIIVLSPLRPASWHVPVHEIGDPETLEKIVRSHVRDAGGIEAPTEADEIPILSGGLALLSKGEVVIEPTCCADLGNLSEWRAAAGYRKSEWRMLWIGHPWLSVRYEGRSLVISEPHESDTPSGRWTVDAGVLDRAVVAAEVELERLYRRLERALMSLGAADRAGRLARRLAGLPS